MPDREKVIEELEKVWDAFNHMEHELYADYVFDALELLKSDYPEYACKSCQEFSCDGCSIKRG